MICLFHKTQTNISKTSLFCLSLESYYKTSLKQVSGRPETSSHIETIMRHMIHASGQHIKITRLPAPTRDMSSASWEARTGALLPQNPTNTPSPSAFREGLLIKDAVPACHRLHSPAGHSPREHHRCVCRQYSGKTISSPGH